jgi:hypothetical protein
MTIYGLLNMVITLVKGLKLKNSKSTFHLLLLFEQGSPIGLLLHTCALLWKYLFVFLVLVHNQLMFFLLQISFGSNVGVFLCV